VVSTEDNAHRIRSVSRGIEQTDDPLAGGDIL